MRVSIPISLFAVLLSTMPTRAQTLTAVSGKSMRMIFCTDTINPDCTAAGQTTIRVTRPPQHGTVRISKVMDFPTFVAANLRSVCNRRRVAGSSAFYTSQRSYVGFDSVGLEIVTSRGGLATRNYTINVR